MHPMNKNIFSHSKKKISTKRPHESFAHRVTTDPYLDWFYMIIFTVILSLVYICVGTFTYLHVKDSLNKPLVEESVGKKSVFNQDLLLRVLKDVEIRTGKRAGAVSGYSGISDPSL